MSKEKENKAFDPEDLLNATISEEGFALVKKVIAEELDDPNANKEAISNVVESLKDQSNITLFRLIEILLLLIPFELTIPVSIAIDHSFKARAAKRLKEILENIDEEDD